MKIATQILDRLLTSVVTSCVIFFFSFSFVTGKFPPQKADMAKAFGLLKAMATSTQEYNSYNKSLEGQPPSLEQLVILQRLALQRSEASLNLSKLMVRFPQGVPNGPIAEKLTEVSEYLTKTDQAMASIQQEIVNTTSNQGGQ